jgi:hypothetical protein
MPKIFEYIGYILFFYSNEHEPMHVHVQYGEFHSRIDLLFENGKLKMITHQTVKGYKPIPGGKQKAINKFLKKYHNEIINKWTDFFILHKKPRFEKITKRIK